MADDKQHPDDSPSGESPGTEAAGAEPVNTVPRIGGDRSDGAAAAPAEDPSAPVAEGVAPAVAESNHAPAAPVGKPAQAMAAPRRRTSWAALFLAGLLGGLVVAGAGGYLWFNYLADDGLTNVLLARLGAVELAVQDLNSHAPQAAPAGPTTEELAARLTKVENALARPPAAGSAAAPSDRQPADAALVARLGAIESLVKSLGEKEANLDRQAAETASALRGMQGRIEQVTGAAPATPPVGKAEFDALAARVATLQQDATSLQQTAERNTASLQQAAKQRAETATADRALRLSIVASGLRNGVERGVPLGDEIKAAKAVVDDPQMLAPLEPFASSGVPSAAALNRELAALAPQLAPRGESGGGAIGYLDRLQAHAERLLRVRPVNAPPPSGDDAAAIVARAEVKAKQADIGGALAELRKLPEPARARAAAWIDKAEARQAAIAATQRIENAARAALANP